MRITPHNPVLIGITLLVSTQTTLAQLTPPPGPVNPTKISIDLVEPRTPITSLPFTINQPGAYFLTDVLTGAVATDGITIQSDDVTLDLNGFTLFGDPGAQDAIRIPAPVSNIHITNGSTSGWEIGIFIDGSDVIISDMVIDDVNESGVEAINGANVSMINLHVFIAELSTALLTYGMVMNACEASFEKCVVVGGPSPGSAVDLINSQITARFMTMSGMDNAIRALQSELRIIDFTIDDCDEGITAENSSIYIIGGVIDSTTTDAIRATNPSLVIPFPTVRIEDVTITTPGDDGIETSDVHLEINNSTIIGAGDAAIDCSRGTLRSDRSAYEQASADALRLLDLDAAWITNTQISRSSNAVLFITDGSQNRSAVLRNVDMLYNNNDALRVQFAAAPPPIPEQFIVTIESCRLVGNNANGMVFNAPATGTIRDNQASRNAMAAIISDPGSHCLRIEGNHLTGNGQGLNVQGPNNIILNNTACDNTGGNYIVAPGNVVGPIVNSGNIATNTNPAANYEQ